MPPAPVLRYSLTAKTKASASTATITELSTGISPTRRVAARSTRSSVPAPAGHPILVHRLQPQVLHLPLALWPHRALLRPSLVLLDVRPHSPPSTQPPGQLLVQPGLLAATRRVKVRAAAHMVVTLGRLMLHGETTRSARSQSAKMASRLQEAAQAVQVVQATRNSPRTAATAPSAARVTP